MPSRFPSTTTLRAAFAVVSTLWLLGACCGPGECVGDDDDDAGPDADPQAFATPGCDVATIDDRQNGDTCAVCAADGGPIEICGGVDVAVCESREDSRGEPCSYCATELGEILYDSCFSDDPVPFVNCESSDPTDPDGPGGDLVCLTCTDKNGVVVAQSCEPQSDECHDDDSGGVSCRVCTRGGDVVVRNCEQPDIAPRSCEAYGDVNVVGRCVDCFGDDDQLLSHSCTLAEDPFISCSESVTPEGLRCFSCFDANGAQVERYCEDVGVELQQCALLDYSEQSCVVCVDERGEPALLECSRTDCVDDGSGSCPPPPECTLELGANGELCRTCPTDIGELEQACVVETNLVCGQAFDEFTGGACLACNDLSTGVEVYRRCDDNGSLPPTCFFIENGVNEVCEVCTDSQTGELVYADCPSQTCSDIGDFSLFSPEGSSLFVEGQPAVASCTQCAAASADGVTVADDFRASCSLLPDCPIDLTNPDAACEGTVTFRVRPRLCENPWENAGFFGAAESFDELLQVLSFALASSLELVAVQHAAGAPTAVCDNSCACDRGGSLLELVARPGDAALTLQLFGAVIEPCASDADCGAGDVCRSDGACG